MLAWGPGAALGLLCAGALWEVWERAVPVRPQVCVPTRGGRRGPRGIEIPRTALDGADVTTRHSIPVTSLPRTLLDLAGVLDTRRLRSAIRQAERAEYRVRDRAMKARGLEVLRFTRREVLSTPAGVGREVADARARLLAPPTHAAGR